jgi:hypothetical protein
MERATCTNYKKLNAVIKKFLATACDMTYAAEVLEPTKIKEQGIDWFDAFRDRSMWTEQTFERKIMLRKDSRCCAVNTEEYDVETVEIHYNIEELFNDGTKQFRENFVRQCPMAKGFADITLAMLHELGHHEVAEIIDKDYKDYDRRAMIKAINEELPRELVNYAYFLLPDEMLATQWAIQWLEESAENRKIAKQFEKEFFKLFSKTS